MTHIDADPLCQFCAHPQPEHRRRRVKFDDRTFQWIYDSFCAMCTGYPHTFTERARYDNAR